MPSSAAGAGATDGVVAWEGVGGTILDDVVGLPYLLLLDGGLSVDSPDESNIINGLLTGVPGGSTALWGDKGRGTAWRWPLDPLGTRASSFLFPHPSPHIFWPSGGSSYISNL